MNILHEVSQLATLPGPVALAIGVFDGLHLGHQAVVQAAMDFTEKHGGTAALLTFDPHPMSVLRPEQAPLMLCSMQHKTVLMKRFGLGTALVLPFTKETAETPATEFVESLVVACKPLGFISVGYEWTFGKGRGGNVHRLMELGLQHGFGVYGVPVVKLDGEVVSSTLIREAVRNGDIERANRLFGREYAAMGKVVEGNKLGRQIGFPTANVDVGAIQMPPNGVYAVRVVGHRFPAPGWPGVANLGLRPTLEENGSRTLEVHLLDFAGDLYGQELEVVFVEKLRDEQKFSGLDELKAQIARDAEQARATVGE